MGFILYSLSCTFSQNTLISGNWYSWHYYDKQDIQLCFSFQLLSLCKHMISKVRYSVRSFSLSLDLKHWRITVVFLLLSNIIIWLSSCPCLWRLTPIWDIPLADLAISQYQQYQVLYVEMMLKLFHGGLSLLEF